MKLNRNELRKLILKEIKNLSEGRYGYTVGMIAKLSNSDIADYLNKDYIRDAFFRSNFGDRPYYNEKIFKDADEFIDYINRIREDHGLGEIQQRLDNSTYYGRKAIDKIKKSVDRRPQLEDEKLEDPISSDIDYSGSETDIF